MWHTNGSNTIRTGSNTRCNGSRDMVGVQCPVYRGGPYVCTCTMYVNVLVVGQ